MTPESQKTPLSIIIPAYNEEDRLPRTLKIYEEWKKTTFFDIELIIVDDGSVDGTKRVVEEFQKRDSSIRLIPEKHVGMMNAILTGFKAAKHPYVANMDADCATHPREYENLVRHMSEYDVAMGSRILREGKPPIQGKSFFRRLLSSGMSLLFRMLFRVNIYDPQIGFKIYKKELILQVLPILALRHDGLKSAEILVKAHGLGYRIKEVPIDYMHDPNSRCVPKHPYIMILEAFMALFALWRLTYQEYCRGTYKVCPVRGALVLRLLHKPTLKPV